MDTDRASAAWVALCWIRATRRARSASSARWWRSKPIDPAQAHYDLARAYMLNQTGREGEGRIAGGAGSRPGLPAGPKTIAGIERIGTQPPDQEMRTESHVNYRDAAVGARSSEVAHRRASARCSREIVTQVRRVIVGQEEVLEQVMIGLFVGGHCLITGLPGTAKTLLVRTMAQTLGPGVQAHSVHARPDAQRHHRHRHHRRGSRPPAAAPGPSCKARSSATSCWPTKSTAPLPRRRARCSKPCRSAAARCAATSTRCPRRSSCWPRRTRSNWKAPIRCPKRSSTASCSTRCWTT